MSTKKSQPALKRQFWNISLIIIGLCALMIGTFVGYCGLKLMDLYATYDYGSVGSSFVVIMIGVLVIFWVVYVAVMGLFAP